MLHADSDLICDQPQTQKQRPEEEEAKQTNPPFFKELVKVCVSVCSAVHGGV